ncbi:MAG TPA: hypothetical protein VL625_11945 [Patescibacteria group bacterium]|nr:hypothetical protein [Patescibacteria group bacterium]
MDRQPATNTNELIHEVEESLRQERIHEMWKEYGPYIITGCILAVLFTGVRSVWHNHEVRVNTTQTAAVVDATEAADPAASLKSVATGLRGGPRAVAMLTEAGTLVENGKSADAVAAYERAANDRGVPEPFRSLALLLEIRTAWSSNSKISTPVAWPVGNDKAANGSALIARLQPLFDQNNPWRGYARVQAALIAAHDLGDYTKAREFLWPVRTDVHQPAAIVSQADMLDRVYAAQGGKEPKR